MDDFFNSFLYPAAYLEPGQNIHHYKAEPPVKVSLNSIKLVLMSSLNNLFEIKNY